MTVYLTGDTHGLYDIDKLRAAAWEGRDWRPTADDYLIIVGDVARIWRTQTWDLPAYDARDQEVIDALTELPWTVLFIDGNHENHDTLRALEAERWHGGLVNRISDRLIHLMRGQVFDIDGLRFFAMGGAHSPDWAHRIEGISWWPEEMPEPDEYDEACANLAAVGGAVDVVLSHTCPTQVIDEIVSAQFSQADELTEWLRRLVDEIDFRYWYFGHFHEDSAGLYDGRFSCVFEGIVELNPETGAGLEVG